MSSVALLAAAAIALCAALLLAAQVVVYLVEGSYSPAWTLGAAVVFAACVYLVYADLWRARRRD